MPKSIGKVSVKELSEAEQVRLIENRWNSSSSLWETVSKTYAANKKIWENRPDWLSKVPAKRSKARANKVFLATESVINNLTGRPSKPNVIPANDTEEGTIISDDLQDFFLAKYRDLRMKPKLRKGLRHLFMSRVVVFKTFWNTEIDDFDTAPIDPRLIRLPKDANSMFEADWALEMIENKPVSTLIAQFPDKEEEILASTGMDAKQALVEDPLISWKEAWIDGYVMWEYNGMILEVQDHPYWDYEGLLVSAAEESAIGQVSGKERKAKLRELQKNQQKRKGEDGDKYQSYLYNHFDKPMIPYCFGTILEITDGPVGETSLIEQVESLQNELDKRKRQISDNAEMMQGKWIVDTNFTNMSKAQAQQLTTNPRGVIFGKGVRQGVDIKTGKELPSVVYNDLEHSSQEIDNIFGTQPTFRGEGGGTETATGRAILREQSFSRLDELIDLVDTLHLQIYAWWFQMMKVRYTEAHYVKPIGAAKADRVIELTRDDLEEGLEIQIIPGQILPEDRLFQAERAKEEAVAGLIDPLTYFEETNRDNPMKLAKRLEMYKINPFSILELDEDDMRDLKEGMELFGALQASAAVAQQEVAAQAQQGAPGAQGAPPGQQQAPDDPEKAKAAAAIRKEAEEVMASQMPEAEKRQRAQELKSQLEQLLQT